MNEVDYQIDEAFLRETVQEFMNRYEISAAKLGRALGFKTKSVSQQGDHGKRFLAGERTITVDNVIHLAEWMQRPLTDFMKNPPKTIVSHGPNAVNVVGSEIGSISRHRDEHLSDELDLITMFSILPADRQKKVLGILQGLASAA